MYASAKLVAEDCLKLEWKNIKFWRACIRRMEWTPSGGLGHKASTAPIFINDLFRGEGIKYQNFPLPVYSSAIQWFKNVLGIVNTQVDVLPPPPPTRFYILCRSQV